MKIHCFAALLVLVFQTAFAREAVPQSYGMPTYESFRMMRADQQTAYIEDLRDMLLKLDEHGLTEPADQAFVRRLLEYAMGGAIPEAQAAPVDCSTVQFEFRGDSFCVKNYPGGGQYGCARQNWQPVVQACRPQFESWKANTAITEKQAPQFNSTFDQFHANDQKKAQAQEDLAAAGLKLMDKAKRNEWDKEADAQKEKFNINCIYAGFTSEKGKKCEPKSEFTSKDKTYSCKAEAKGGAATSNRAAAPVGKAVVRPAGLTAATPVLCNPVLFGLNEKGEPYCVGRKGGATKQCLEDAKKNPKSLEAARKLLIENKDEYIKLRNTLTKICVGSSAAEVENYLVKTMKKSRKGARDLGQTCEAYSQRFKDYDASGAQSTIQDGTR